ncbi:MAG: phage tail assembly chaperone [Alphaproteobacteria bacterium]|nr:phage tail assembly chaperone [Alphaproteobacteria bacterium]
MHGGQWPFRWDAWLAYGLGVLRLPPESFWRLSLVEWRALLPPRAPSLARRGLEDLMQRYPDGRHA